MREYGFSLAHIFPYKDKLYESIQVSENPYSCIFYGVYFINSVILQNLQRIIDFFKLIFINQIFI